MTWNYRFMKDEDGFLNCHEVYYDKDGKPEGYTAEPINPFAMCEDVEEILINADRIKKAAKKPILTKEGFNND